MSRLSLPAANPSRKERFRAALQLARIPVVRWRTKIHPVSWTHLNEVLDGTREGSAELNAAIDATIAKYLPSPAE